MQVKGFDKEACEFNENCRRWRRDSLVWPLSVVYFSVFSCQNTKGDENGQISKWSQQGRSERAFGIENVIIFTFTNFVTTFRQVE